MTDKFRTFAMSHFCSFPPKVAFPRCSEVLFPLTKIQDNYHTDNQLVIFLSIFRGYPYLTYNLHKTNSRQQVCRMIPLTSSHNVLNHLTDGRKILFHFANSF